LGAAYRLDEKTVVRAGYRVSYTQAFYSGWNGGMNLDGFNPVVNLLAGELHLGKADHRCRLHHAVRPGRLRGHWRGDQPLPGEP